MSNEVQALRVVPPPGDLEGRIRFFRRCMAKCPMVATLDERMVRQKKLVETLLEKKGWTVEQLEMVSYDKLEDPELRLCWHILRDVDYIDSLR